MFGEALQFVGGDAVDEVGGLPGEDRFAESGGVQRAAFTGVGVQIEPAGAAHRVQVENPFSMECSEVDEAGTGAGRFLHDEEGGSIDRGIAEVAGSSPEGFSCEAIAAAGAVLFDEAGFNERGDEAVGGGERLVEARGEVGEMEFVGLLREEFEGLKAFQGGGHGWAAGGHAIPG